MQTLTVLKAISEETRMKILTLLLKHNYCVRALARNLSLTEATISQHLKVLREAGLLVGEKHGYFIHYDVKRTALLELSNEIKALSELERKACTSETGDYYSDQQQYHAKGKCSEETIEFCHGMESESKEGNHHGDS